MPSSALPIWALKLKLNQNRMQMLKKRLTLWRGNPRTDIVRGNAIVPNMAVAAHYRADLDHLISQMILDVTVRLSHLYDTEHAREYFAEDAAIVRAAGIMFISPDDKVLLMKRRDGYWAFPGGKIESGELPDEAARREVMEETQHVAGAIEYLDFSDNGKVQFTTFLSKTEKFIPFLDYEHSEYIWASPDDLPSPLHRLIPATLQLYYKDTIAEDATVSSQSKILMNLLRKKWEKLFDGISLEMATNFAKQTDKTSAANVQASAQIFSGGLTIPQSALTGDLLEIYKATIAENVSLIKSIPQKYLTGVEQAVFRNITGTEGKDNLVAYLQREGEVTYARAKMIASDQTAKANFNFSKARLIKLGVKKAEWRHVPSNHPRKTHEAMNGKIFDLSEVLYDSAVGRNVLPSELPNCRCRAAAVITFEDEDAT